MSVQGPMPGPLASIDDPWDIAWRARMVVRRLRPRVAARFLSAYARGARHRRPVFVIGVPRSGNTTLLRLLEESSELCSPPHESHLVWLAYHHPRKSGWTSAAIGAGEVRLGERRLVNSFFYAYCGRHRFVEKAPANSLRIPHIREIFPDALFVRIRRNPCDVVNALIKGWRLPGGGFRSYYVPEDLRIPGYPHSRQWRFALIPGWRECIGRPVHEIAFAQWERISAATESARSEMPSSNWVDAHLEDLCDRPGESVSMLCERIGIANDERLLARLLQLNEKPAGATSPPVGEKWRQENEREVSELLPRIAAAAPQSGYHVDPDTGAFEIRRPISVGGGPERA